MIELGIRSESLNKLLWYSNNPLYVALMQGKAEGMKNWPLSKRLKIPEPTLSANLTVCVKLSPYDTADQALSLGIFYGSAAGLLKIDPPDYEDPLTLDELVQAKLMILGYNNEQIKQLLNTRESPINTRAKRIYRKLDAINPLNAIAKLGALARDLGTPVHQPT